MSETNGESANRIVRDLGALLDHLHPDVEWDNTGNSPPDHHGLIRGKAAVARIITEWVDAWDGYRIEVEEVIEAGDDVILVVAESGVGHGSGVPMSHRHCYRWTFRDGLIVSGTEYASKEQALAAIRG